MTTNLTDYKHIAIAHRGVPIRLFWFLCGNEVYTDSFFFQNSPKSLAQ